MRIALVCSNRLPCPPVKGGAIQLLIHEMAAFLPEYGHEVTIFSIQDASLPNEETINGIIYRRFPENTYLDQVLSSIRSTSFDLIQVYNRPQWVSQIRKVSPRSLVILSLHNLILGHTLPDEESKQAVLDADYILTVSKFLAQDIKDRFPKASKKITPMYSGVNTHSYTPRHSKQGRLLSKSMKEKLHIPDNYKVILYVGRLTSYKGCHLLIDSMEDILSQHPETALVIVGSKWYSDTSEDNYIQGLKKRAEKISKHIVFTNYVPVSKIPDYYTMADILVCPSQWKEPLARVHYEAMAAGLPIVTTNRGGNPEVVKNGKNGWVVKDYNHPKAFAKPILKLLDSNEKQKAFGNRNRKLAEQQYTFKKYASKLNQLYKKLNKKKKGT